MRRRDVYLAAPLLVVLVGLGWLTFGRSHAPAPLGDGTSDGNEDPDAPDPLDPSHGGSRAGGGGLTPRPPTPVPAVPTFPRAEGVFGRITDARETPIPGARVTLLRLDPTIVHWEQGSGEAMFTADAAADGSYLVGPMTTGSYRWRVRAEAPGFARGGADVPTKGSRIDVHLDRGGSIDVRVRDLPGAPIANAVVRAGEDLPFTRVTGSTDAAGTVRLDGLPLGGVELVVECPGYASATSNDVVVSADTVFAKSIVLRGAIRLTGRVTLESTGEGVAGASVSTANGQGEPGALVTTARTDAEGRFSLDALGRAGTRVEVTARKAGLGSASTWTQLRATDATGAAGGPGGGAADDVLLRLGAPSTVSGTVVDADSRPVASATVVFANVAGTRGLGEAVAHTDTDGRFTLEMPPGTNRDGSYGIAAFAPGKGLGVTTMTPSRSPSTIVRLLGAGTIAGTVRAPDGTGAEGAIVRFHSVESTPTDPPTATTEFNPAQYQQATYDARLTLLDASTDAQGGFHVDTVPIGTYVASVSWRGMQVGASTAVSVRAGGSATLDVTLKAGGVIEGRVLDPGGLGIAGARIGGWDPQNNQPNENRFAQARSDAEGRFVLREVLGDNWSLRVQATGFLESTVSAVRAGDRSVEVRLTPLGWVDGLVLGPDGKAYPGEFDASALPTGDDGSDRDGSAASFSGAGGTFRLRGLAAGAYVVSATTSDGLVPAISTTVNVVNGAGAGPVEIRLAVGASIRGSVLEEGSRRPLPGATVAILLKGDALSGGRSGAWNTTDGKGRFAALGLAAGTYGLVVTDTNGGSYEESLTLDPGQAVEREFVTRRPGAISVRVVDRDGRPVAKARVMLRTPGGAVIQPNWDALRRENRVDLSRGGWDRAIGTDEGGRLTRWHVPPGRVEVMIRSRTTPMKHEPVTVDVASDRTTEVTVTLSPDDGAGR